MKKWTFGSLGLTSTSGCKRKKPVEDVLCSDNDEIYQEFLGAINGGGVGVDSNATTRTKVNTDDLNEGIYDFDLDLVRKLANDLNGNNCNEEVIQGVAGDEFSQFLQQNVSFTDEAMAIDIAATNDVTTDVTTVVQEKAPAIPQKVVSSAPPSTLPLLVGGGKTISAPPPRPPKSPSTSVRSIANVGGEAAPSLPPKKGATPTASPVTPSPNKNKMPSFFKSLFSPKKSSDKQLALNNTVQQQQQQQVNVQQQVNEQ
jgi:hypothetical protein